MNYWDNVDSGEVSQFQYRTIKRLQKNYLVRCNESLTNILKGNGVKPGSAISRCERELGKLRKKLGKLTEQEILAADEKGPSQKKQQRTQQMQTRRTELQDAIMEKEKELLAFQVL
jgi:hypothetical protein